MGLFILWIVALSKELKNTKNDNTYLTSEKSKLNHFDTMQTFHQLAHLLSQWLETPLEDLNWNHIWIRSNPQVVV